MRSADLIERLLRELLKSGAIDLAEYTTENGVFYADVHPNRTAYHLCTGGRSKCVFTAGNDGAVGFCMALDVIAADGWELVCVNKADPSQSKTLFHVKRRVRKAQDNQDGGE